MNKLNGFTLIESLIALLIFSIMGSLVLKSFLEIKKQELTINIMRNKTRDLVHTQILLNNYFSLLIPNSIKIYSDKIEWDGYSSLFLNSKSGNRLDFSLDKAHYVLRLDTTSLLLNESLLLNDVQNIKFELNSEYLHYEICTKTCIKDFVLIENSIIELELSTT